jgi:hypothetical protein
MKVDKAITGWVTLTIDDKEVLKAQVPIFGEKEAKTTYEGSELSMVVSSHVEARKTIWDCLVYADHKQIGQFTWH